MSPPIDTAPPAATVIFPTKNRRDELRRALVAVLNQGVALTVMVMDDGSTDDTAAMVREEFPTVQVHRSEESHGPTFQRNKAANLATTEFIVTLDDDCELASTDTVAATLADFDEPRVGGVTIPFVNILHEDLSVRTGAPDNDHKYITLDYFGGMIAFRRDAFLAAGGYRTYFFMHFEESDLAIRMLDIGYVVRLGRCPPLNHHESPIRNRARVNQLGPRNTVLFAWYNVPMPSFPLHLVGTTINATRHALKNDYLSDALRGVVRGYGGVVHEWRQRMPVRQSVYRLSRQLRRRGSVPLAQAEHLLPTLPPAHRPAA